ncbi:hypothetical protein ACT3CD_03435 [Geofilum sp. OHC36d9]|uniref:hypothetical protein n=1 Tax=Geofilum sp. OHC36d9 TaxID=3458413 RepID=UPI0040333D0E
MKKIILLGIFLSSFLVKAQEEQPVNFIETPMLSFGINGGVIHNMNGFNMGLDDNGSSYYGIDGGGTLGIDMAVKLSSKFRTRLGLRYAEMQYGMTWSGGDVNTFYKTDVKVYNMELNLNLDYMLFQGKRFELFLSPGLLSEFVADVDYKNYRNDDSFTYTKFRNFNTTQHPKSIAGFNISAIGRIPLTQRIGITLTPGYTYFLRNYVLDNDKAYQRFTFDFGFDFRFF